MSPSRRFDPNYPLFQRLARLARRARLVAASCTNPNCYYVDEGGRARMPRPSHSARRSRVLRANLNSTCSAGRHAGHWPARRGKHRFAHFGKFAPWGTVLRALSTEPEFFLCIAQWEGCIARIVTCMAQLSSILKTRDRLRSEPKNLLDT